MDELCAAMEGMAPCNVAQVYYGSPRDLSDEYLTAAGVKACQPVSIDEVQRAE